LVKSTKVKSHGNDVRDAIIAHVISADADRHRKHKAILEPGSCAQSTQSVGKK